MDVFNSFGGKCHVSYGVPPGSRFGKVGMTEWKVINQSSYRTYDLMFQDLDNDGVTDVILKTDAPGGRKC